MDLGGCLGQYWHWGKVDRYFRDGAYLAIHEDTGDNSCYNDNFFPLSFSIHIMYRFINMVT